MVNIMTPKEVPVGATRHALSVSKGCRVFYTDTHSWNGSSWRYVGDTTSYSSPLSDEPFLKTTRDRHIGTVVDVPIHSRFD